MGCFQASLVLLVCFILTGCTSEQSPKEDSPTPLLEDLFDPGRISVFFGGQEYSGVGYELGVTTDSGTMRHGVAGVSSRRPTGGCVPGLPGP